MRVASVLSYEACVFGTGGMVQRLEVPLSLMT